MNRLPLSGWLSQGVPPGRRPAAVWLNRGVTPACAVLEVGMPTVVFPIGRTDKDFDMIIGVDPHKLSHTATAVDPLTNIAAASLRVDASLVGYRELLVWARRFPDRRWAIENAKGLGCHLAQWLIARGRVTAEDDTTMFALLEERRANVAGQRVRAVNQLHALMRDLIPGGAKTALTAKVAAAALRRVRPITPADQTRKDIARDLVRDIRGIDERLTAIAERMTSALAERGSSLIEVDGIGPVLGVRLIGRTGPAARFRSSDAFASYAGVAPVEVSSGERITHRLSRSGDRQLNSALHLVAVTQVRMRGSAGRQFYDRKINEGKTRNEAMRCLKRRIAAHVWRRMLADERRRVTQSHESALAA